ncbi:MAG: glycoside hydrolase family 32 protein, partial [Propionibacteriaceae bacterium]|nr:glycoside hydrolase family 32 protein [Propionibacteriaceae bacterium]
MLAGDPSFPFLHIRPVRGWLNDPNGLCLIDGRYHVFFQYNPAAPRHGGIVWGHASSSDLLSWRYEPVALHNRPGRIDQEGCWSGCITDDAGIPTAVYTAVADTAHNAQVVLARSDRSLRDWAQDDTPVQAPPDDPAISDVRDPFLFWFRGHRYAIQGAGHQADSPQVLLYGCDDLTSWRELGSLLTYADPISAQVAPAQVWECPNLVAVDGSWVLIVSLWQWVAGTYLLAGVRYLLGQLCSDGPGLRFIPAAGGLLDAGPTFYAPQVLPLTDRVLLWGWAWEHGRSPEAIDRAGWAGVLTFPRELFVDGDTVGSRPATELLGLRREIMGWQSGVGFASSAFEVE